MNGKPHEIHDHELHAYVDGQLPEERRAEIEAALAGESELAAKLQAYAAQNRGIAALFGGVAAEPVPARLNPRRIAARLSRRRWLVALAASVAWLGIGLAGGWLAHERLRAPAGVDVTGLVARQAVSAYRVYTVEVLHPVEVFAEQEQHLVKWLSKRLGYRIRTPDLAPVGFVLVGGRLLPASDGSPAAQFMYEDAAGRRLTLYVAPNDSGEETAFRFEELDGVSAFIWLEQGMGFAMTGELPREQLLEISKLVYATFEPKI